MSLERDGVDEVSDEQVVVPYDDEACQVMLTHVRGIRDYWLANWHVHPQYADHLADGLHDLMFSPPRDGERAATPGPDLGVTASALRRAIRQPTGAPPPALRSVPRSG